MLTAIGNVLDLPGSMARDALMLRNPLDQLLDPFSQEGRTSGQDILNNFGLEDSPWLSLALEMGLDPTTYIGAGAITKGAKGMGLVSKGASLGKTAGRAAKAVGRAAMKPGKTIDWLAEMPMKLRGREGEIASGLRARVENAFAGLKGRFASPVTEAKASLDEIVQRGAAPFPRDVAAARRSMANEDMMRWLTPEDASDYQARVRSARSDIAAKALVMRSADVGNDDIRKAIGQMLVDETGSAYRDATSGLNARSRRTTGEHLDLSWSPRYLETISAPRNPRNAAPAMNQSVAESALSRFLETISAPRNPRNAAPAMNQSVAESALSRARKGFNLSGMMDSTVYNPDLIRMALGGMAINSAAAGRAQNPMSHAYMGYYE